MACDTVAGWQVVLANGEIVEANADENADLWQVSCILPLFLIQQTDSS